jgi:hypothetical protein
MGVTAGPIHQWEAATPMAGSPASKKTFLQYGKRHYRDHGQHHPSIRLQNHQDALVEP